MKKFTTEILIILIICFLGISTAFAQPNINSWSDNTFMIRFDASIPQSEIDDLMFEYHAEEIWVSPLTQTRLWHITEDFPHWTASNTDYFVNIQQNSAHGRSKAGGQGGSGLNYNVKTHSNNGQLGAGPGGPGGNGPVNPNPMNPDEQMDCHSEMFTYIGTGNNPVKLGIFDTGKSEFTDFHNYHWMYGFDVTGENYIDGNVDYSDWNGHGNHISSTIMHLTHKAYATGLVSANPDVSYRIMKTFDDSAYGYVAEIIYAFETEVVNGLQIANFSWRFNADAQEADLHPLKESLSVAEELYDVLIVCAAGNDASNTDSGFTHQGNVHNAFPAAYDFDNILTVTSFNCVNNFTSFANKGASSVDVAAPGLEIPGIWTDNVGSFQLDYLYGTSMSSAIVSAAATQLATHQSVFDAQKIKCAIIEGAEFAPLIAPNVVSNGLLNVDNALNILGNCTNGGNGGNGGKRFVSIDNNSGFQVNTGIYPNPSFGDFEISIESDIETNFVINILNNMGQLVYTKSDILRKGYNDFEMNISNLNAGFYQVIIDSDNGILATKKISVMK